MLAAKIRLLLHQEPLTLHFFPVLFLLRCVGLNLIFGRNHVGPAIDRTQPITVVGIHHLELELCHSRKLLARFLDFFGAQSRYLDQDPVLPDRADDWFGSAEIVNAFANYFDRLVERRRRDLFVAGLLQSDQK